MPRCQMSKIGPICHCPPLPPHYLLPGRLCIISLNLVQDLSYLAVILVSNKLAKLRRCVSRMLWIEKVLAQIIFIDYLVGMEHSKKNIFGHIFVHIYLDTLIPLTCWQIEIFGSSVKFDVSAI